MSHRDISFCFMIIVSLAALTGCGSEGSPGDALEGPLEVMVPLDTVGVELGDENLVFGAIASVDFTPEGELLVLDSNRQTLRVFSPEGVFLAEYGGPGEAPGELLSVRDMAVTGDGVVAVTDPRAGEFEFFDPDTGYTGTLMGFSPRAPFTIDADDRLIVGHQGLFNREEGTSGEALAGWSKNSAEPEVVYMEEWSRFDPGMMASRFMDPEPPLEVADSLVFYAPLDYENYRILVFDGSGASPKTISRPGYSPVRKTQREIDEEMELFEQRRQQMMGMGRGGPAMASEDYAPREFHFAVRSLGSDAEGRLWARRGGPGTPVFDLFDRNTGDWLGTVSGPDGMESWTFVVTPYGIAAYEEDPLDYPKVVLLGY
jgi:hypothetical protein